MRWLLDAAIAFCVFTVFSWTAVPDVNEAHYFTKAQQFWDPNWLPQDLFLNSGFAHATFYWLFGWPTTWLELETTVWLGRVVGWIGLAIGWTSLATALHWTRRQHVLGAACFAILTSQFNLSGEWVVGGIEAKVPSYALVLGALAAAIGARWPTCWLLLGLATALHPLVGGWSWLAILPVRWSALRRTRVLPREYLAAAMGLVAAFAGGMIPALMLDANSDSATQAAAHWIYVRERLSHHLYIWDFSVWQVIRFALVVGLWREFVRPTPRLPAVGKSGAALSSTGQQSATEPGPALATNFQVLDRFACGALLLSLIGLGISSGWLPSATENALLRFYWFRLADMAIPLALTAHWMAAIDRTAGGGGHAANRRDMDSFDRKLWLAAAAVALCGGLFLVNAGQGLGTSAAGADRQSLPQYPGQPQRTEQTRLNWQKACGWIRAHTADDAVFLTPRFQQTFKWYAARAEYVNWKDIPQDSVSLVEWSRRMQLVYGARWEYPSALGLDLATLEHLARQSGVQYLVAEQREYQQYLGLEAPPEWLDLLKQVYPEDTTRQATYVVLELSF